MIGLFRFENEGLKNRRRYHAIENQFAIFGMVFKIKG
jgi:hypothetical protein